MYYNVVLMEIHRSENPAPEVTGIVEVEVKRWRGGDRTGTRHKRTVEIVEWTRPDGSKAYYKNDHTEWKTGGQEYQVDNNPLREHIHSLIGAADPQSEEQKQLAEKYRELVSRGKKVRGKLGEIKMKKSPSMLRRALSRLAGR